MAENYGCARTVVTVGLYVRTPGETLAPGPHPDTPLQSRGRARSPV